jgi:hypothetical protein
VHKFGSDGKSVAPGGRLKFAIPYVRRVRVALDLSVLCLLRGSLTGPGGLRLSLRGDCELMGGECRALGCDVARLSLRCRVGFANSGGLVFMDESAEEIPTL